MIIGFSKHGHGDGGRAIDYLTDGAEEVLPYLTGQTKRGKERNPPPVVLRGDPRLMRTLLDSVPFARKYTSGVLSFEEPTIPPETEAEIMNRFEETAFAGLSKDRYAIVWVRHNDKGREELHFVSPAMDLASGKSLNINPPRESTRQTFDTLRRLINDEFRFSDPDDPTRARAIRVPSYAAKGALTRGDLRATVAEFLQAKQHAGLLRNHEDVLRTLNEAGLQVSRSGQDYVTVVDSEGMRCRLKGSLFRRDFTPTPKDAQPSRLSPQERVELQTKLSRLVAARAEFNQRRYGDQKVLSDRLPPLPEISGQLVQGKAYDRTGSPPSGLAAAFGGRIGRSRCPTGTTLEQCRDGAFRWREGIAELGRAGQRLGVAGNSLAGATRAIGSACQQLDQSGYEFGRAAQALPGRLTELAAEHQRRAVSEALLARYGIPQRQAAAAAREFDRGEMERDLADGL